MTQISAGGPAEEILQLPPFVVSQLPEGLPWQYARVANIEVLTLCPQYITRDFVEAQLRGLGFLPELFQPRRSAPIAIVAFSQESATLKVAQRMSANSTRWRNAWYVPNVLASTDRDSLIISANLRELDIYETTSAFYARELLRECTPSAPAWLGEGLFGNYGLFPGAEGIQAYRNGDSILLPAMMWGNAMETEAARTGRLVPKLMPLDNFFNEPPPDVKLAPLAYRLWCSQAALFVRWQLFGVKQSKQTTQAFWLFAYQAWRGPVTAAAFKESFHLDYATAGQSMLTYLQASLSGPRDVGIPQLHQSLPELSSFHLRPATEAEVARLKGNFERMEANRLRADFPELAKQYEDAALRTLRRGLKAAGNDPQVRGILGQLEFDTGHPAEARPHLEAAAAAGQAGTRALLALARVRLDEERAKLPADSKLSAEALGHVLTPLFVARARKPAVVDVYLMIAEVWAHSGVAPTRGNLTVLLEGAQLFPENHTLFLRAAELHSRHGFASEAMALAEQGKKRAADAAIRERFAGLITSTPQTP